MMKIEGIEVFPITIPFRMTFTHALASRAESAGVVVRLDAGGVSGFGECAPRPYVTGETVESALADIPALADDFLGRTFAGFDEVTSEIDGVLASLPRERHAAFCAVELAVLDLAGRVFDRAAGDVLGPIASEEIVYSGVVSADGAEAVATQCRMMREFGFTAVKLKVGADAETDLAALTAARDVLGPGVSLRVDANCVWTADEAVRRLERFRGLDLAGVEQPVAANDLDGLARLRGLGVAPIIVDESLVSLDDARRLIDAGACDVFNVRVSKCGGLVNSARIRDLAGAHGLACMLGAQVGETAILSAAGRQFATRTPSLRFAEGSYGTLLLEEDLDGGAITIGRGGRAPAIRGHGLGVEVREDVLARIATGGSASCR